MAGRSAHVRRISSDVRGPDRRRSSSHGDATARVPAPPSLVGLLLGPMYPILVKQSRDILPKWLFTGCVGWIGGVGQAGSAVLPFITGLLASKFGIGSLQPL